MTETQGEYTAGGHLLTSTEQLCNALKLSGQPADYSTTELFRLAAEHIEKIENERDYFTDLYEKTAEECDKLRLMISENKRTIEKLIAERDEARKIARRLWREKADNWQISGRMICI